jgi:hypothetical protein
VVINQGSLVSVLAPGPSVRPKNARDLTINIIICIIYLDFTFETMIHFQLFFYMS